ncbi:hypothetical protein IMCC3317_14030 [Kordia antarctica]|uniref:Uncharacterized protein n=1 Tax=Kordia antarctica TaxID=1218801 RepID=A0A7L4ZHN9_9FLAO|nr:hypothetical protein [Kordia antarctica]QHI36050.1 hypothetical protein IMCC3317_14030 [Kordia antarctica]
MNITIQNKHQKGTEFIDLTDIEKDLLKFVETKIRKHIKGINCFTHSKSIFDIMIQLIDGIPDIHVFVCCPNFGIILDSELKKEKIHINCSYIKPVGLSSQN